MGQPPTPPRTPLATGVLQALCFAFKLGHRSRLLPHTPRAWALLTTHFGVGSTSGGDPQAIPPARGGVLARKLVVKLTQRVGLTYLEPRIAPWRYVRADAGADLQARLGGSQDLHAEADPQARRGGSQAAEGVGSSGRGGTAEGAEVWGGPAEAEEEGFEVAEEVEDVIQVLLEALTDKDTVVRWVRAVESPSHIQPVSWNCGVQCTGVDLWCAKCNEPV